MLNEDLVKAVDNKEEWDKIILPSISFWEKWFANKGLSWKKDYETRTDPNTKLQDFFLKYLDKSTKNKILDVGSGPLTFINKKCDFAEIEISAVDTLADEYNKIIDKFMINPVVRTQKCEGEKLSEKFDENSFDITFSRNAIDHAYNPLKIIEEMVKITKKGRHIILIQGSKEGTRTGWKGLHQWDFYIKEDVEDNYNFFLKGKNTSEFNLSLIFKEKAELMEIITKKRQIMVIYKKL